MLAQACSELLLHLESWLILQNELVRLVFVCQHATWEVEREGVRLGERDYVTKSERD